MKFISTKTHGILDYLMGLLLIVSPWLFGFARGGAETWILVILGLGIIAYSALTDYEYGAIRQISMRTHLWLDGMGGLLLAASPWLFGFAEYVFWPHLIFGLLEIGAALTTHTSPLIESEVDMADNRNRSSVGQNAYQRNSASLQAQAGTTAATHGSTQAQTTAKANTGQTQSKNTAASPQSKSNQGVNSSIKRENPTSSSSNQAVAGSSDAQAQSRPAQPTSKTNADVSSTIDNSNNKSNMQAKPTPQSSSAHSNVSVSNSRQSEGAGNQNRPHRQHSNEKQTFVQNDKRDAGNPNKSTQEPRPNRNQPNPSNPDPKISPDRGSGQQQVNAKNSNRDTESSDNL